MKIIFITRESKQMPAVRVRCYGFAKYLNEAGIETEIFSFADNLGAKSGKQESLLSLKDKISYNLKAFRYLAAQDAVLLVQRCNYHSFAPLVLSLLSGKKLIFDLDDWEARENLEYYFNRIPKSKAEIMMRFMAKSSTMCIGASRFLVDYLLKYNKKVVYLSTAVDTDYFKPDNSRENKTSLVLSWLGTMHRKDNLENIEFLLECFQTIYSRYPQLRLEILGEGIYYAQVQELVRNIGCSNILLKPWISPEKIPQYMQQIDIGIMPLIQNTKFNKAKSPTRLFEYMAMAKPVIVSGIGESAQIIEHGINGMIAQTKQEFIDMLVSLIENKSMRKTLGENARKTVEANFSLKKTGNMLLEELKKI